METFRATMKRHREMRGWSQDRLGYMAVLNHSLVSRIESGQRNPTRDNLARLCDALRLGEGERDYLYLLAGFTPPDLDVTTLLRLVTSARAA